MWGQPSPAVLASLLAIAFGGCRVPVWDFDQVKFIFLSSLEFRLLTIQCNGAALRGQPGTAVPTFCSVWMSLRRAMSPIVRRGFYRRQLPHLQRDYRPHFVMFCTYGKWV